MEQALLNIYILLIIISRSIKSNEELMRLLQPSSGHLKAPIQKPQIHFFRGISTAQQRRFPSELSQTSPEFPVTSPCTSLHDSCTPAAHKHSRVCPQTLQESSPHLIQPPPSFGVFPWTLPVCLIFFRPLKYQCREKQGFIYEPHTCSNRNCLKTLRHFYSSKIPLSLEKSLISGEERDSSQGPFVI